MQRARSGLWRTVRLPVAMALSARAKMPVKFEFAALGSTPHRAAGGADLEAVASSLRTMDITDGAAACFPGARIRFNEHGGRIDAELPGHQWRDGGPETVYPASAAVAAPPWPSR